jgi:hypothetical protein
MSIMNPSMQLASILSVVLAGWLASTVLLRFHASVTGIHFGRIDTIFLICAALVIAAAVFAAVTLHGVDRPVANTRREPHLGLDQDG